jgi:hypothetical protein
VGDVQIYRSDPLNAHAKNSGFGPSFRQLRLHFLSSLFRDSKRGQLIPYRGYANQIKFLAHKLKITEFFDEGTPRAT